VRPALTAGTGARLTFAEREQIAVLRAGGMKAAQIARELGRHRSTIGRELKRTPRGPNNWRRPEYLPSTAQADADQKARRPKQAKLAVNLRLRREVQDRLVDDHSPEQISRRLREEFPEDPEMWVSHETIYQSLYVQSRGGLKRELAAHLRTGRTMRKPQRQADQRRERFAGMVMISERPPGLSAFLCKGLT
jgi:IS30 family transposase